MKSSLPSRRALVSSASLLVGAAIAVAVGCSSSTDDGTVKSADGGGVVTGTNPDGGKCSGASCVDGAVIDPPKPDPVDGTTTNPTPAGLVPRVVAYVNCMCGFGIGLNGSTCLAAPDPNVNQVKAWEDDGSSPITHYIISFLSFQGGEIQTDPGDIWKSGGGSTTDFNLAPNLRDAMKSAQTHGKKVMLSIGGELGSSGFVGWWRGNGADSPARVTAMRTKLLAVAQKFKAANDITVDGFDVDIELGGVYKYESDSYLSTRDLIAAVPEPLLVAFVPQVGNGLCAAPVAGDPLDPSKTLGGQCQQPVNGDDSPWVLARLDKDVKRADGSPRLDWFGIQYYNAGQAECCGGGGDATAQVVSATQNYKNLANGWPGPGDMSAANNPFHQWQYYPGPWAAFGGMGPERLVLGKPGCQGCAGSDYVDMAGMQQMLTSLDGKLKGKMGGILFWDLCRLFGDKGPQCVSGTCQPSWGGANVKANLTTLASQMGSLKTRTP